MKITSFTPKTLELLKLDIEHALKLVSAQHCINLKVGKIVYDSGTATIKLEAGVMIAADDGMTVLTKERVAFHQYAETYGLTQDCLGKKCVIRGMTLTVAGLNVRRAKNPIQLQHEDGRIFFSSAATVKRTIQMSEVK